MIKYSDIPFAKTHFNFVSSNKTIDQINSSHIILVVFTNDATTGQLTLMSLPVLLSRRRTSVMGCAPENVDNKCSSLLSFQSVVLTSTPSMFVTRTYELRRNSVFIGLSSRKEQFGNLFRQTVPTHKRYGILFYEILRPVATTCSNCKRKSYGSNLSARISSDE
jgi:hypothetical protein